MIDVLRFNERLEVILQHFGEIVLELGSAKIFQDLLPVGWVLNGQHLLGIYEGMETNFAYIVSTQVGLQFSGKDLKRCAFSDTVGSDKAENLPRPRGGKPMKLESVGGITVGDFRFKVGGKIDDGNSFKGTSYTKLIGQKRADSTMNLLLYANTTADTQKLGYECDFV